jgi:hypothetical protein
MKTNTKTVETGDLVKDRITGFSGIAVAKTTWINGCVRWTVQPTKLTKEGAQRPTECFDHEQMVVVRKAVVPAYGRTEPAGTRGRRGKAPGGPRPAPGRPASPKRF